MKEFKACEVTIDGAVATVTILAPGRLTRGTADLHWELGEAFSMLRGNTDVRIVILTGQDGQFYKPREKEFYESEAARAYLMNPKGAWQTFTGLIRTHQAMAELEKPIIAKVNGPAIGFGSSLVFACDLIVAVEDAPVVDMHLGMGEVPEGGPAYGIVPGDGGASLVPLFMTPAIAKEFLMLAKRWTAAELAEHKIINYAVKPEALDAKVDELVTQLLKRPSYALAWTKRVINRPIVDRLNMTLDAGAAYEMINFLQLDRSNWIDPKSL
ncbi:enoyl-CoA hydratase/isomerase family protein [Alsobacter sp. R-9]